MKVVGIIPARYGSTRFEGKPLADICGKPMIQRVYERASESIQEVYVATDDQRIYDAVTSFGGKVVMTSSEHETGTNRCLEASEIIQKKFDHDIVVNIQGDEPLLEPNILSILTGLFRDLDVEFATLIRRVHSLEPVLPADGVYVIKDFKDEAIYFSRSPIPYIREKLQENWSQEHVFYKHIGVYGYTIDALAEFAKMEKTPLEVAESLEQNRWIENDRTIHVAEVAVADTSIPVDTPEDLQKVINIIENDPSLR